MIYVVGGTEVIRNMNAQIAALKIRSIAGMWEAVAIAEGQMKRYTPLRHGNLRGSYDRHVREYQDRIIGEITNTASYAIYVHEIPRAQYTTPGTGWKFMERGLSDSADRITEVLRQHARIPDGEGSGFIQSRMAAARLGGVSKGKSLSFFGRYSGI